MWDHTTASDGSFDQGVKLFVSSDGQLEMSGCDSLDLQVFRSVACEFENLSSEVLKDSSAVDSGSSTNSAVGADSALQESVDSADWELYDKAKLGTILYLWKTPHLSPKV